MKTIILHPSSFILYFALSALFAVNLFADPPSTTAPPGVATSTGPDGILVKTGANSGLLGVNGSGLTLNGTPLGSAAIPATNVLFVDANGNDGTAAVGDPTHPWATAQAAYVAAATYSAAHSNCPVLLQFGVGSFGGIALTADWNSSIFVRGMGRGVSLLGGISGQNAGGNGYNVTLISDGSLDLTNVLCTGDANGDAPGNINLTGAFVSGTIDASGSQSTTGINSISGNITLTNCTVNEIDANGGNGGSGGGNAQNITVRTSLVTGPVNNNGTIGGGNDGVLLAVSSRFQNLINQTQGGGSCTMTSCFYYLAPGGSNLYDICFDGLPVDLGTPFTGAGTSEIGARTTNIAITSND